MKWIEAKVIFDLSSDSRTEGWEHEEKFDLISNVFYDFGLQGVVVESTTPEPPADWADDAEETPEHDAVTGYFPKNEVSEKKCEILEQELIRLKQKNGIITRIVYREIDEEDWAESWKAYFWPEKITKTIVVKPTWREYFPLENEIVLEIDPGMAFGTGTHPTTALCLRMIENYLKPGDSFLDIGTGSGILMVAAAKLGADKVCGSDSDEVAVEVARKNLILNRINTERFGLLTGNLADEVEDQFDLVTANILSQVIVVLLDSVKKTLKKNGIFICSGIIEKNKDTVVEKMKAVGFRILEIQTDQEWVSIAGKVEN
ncbi:50S ribosomal protein L11 methyltransferase [Desulfonema magnum]|uniref:Ribosomal protein L11 methyltransferase n=1 Tax=Desulfonema magnum TaxID=45655 RepID=A0A975GPM6_9BACT|nr:50S ribosomal protein L11 methyltransferase [Desulfonema magnum]QTA88994.1 Ribosomal protein L11 methyltransferase [Desulfonema magnum]